MVDYAENAAFFFKFIPRATFHSSYFLYARPFVMAGFPGGQFRYNNILLYTALGLSSTIDRDRSLSISERSRFWHTILSDSPDECSIPA